MENFEYLSNPARVIFGSGTVKSLPDELKHLKLSNPVIVSTPSQVSQAKDIETILKTHVEVAGIFSNVTMHTPVEVTDTAVEFAKSRSADSIISVGGGSTIGLGKAISIRTGLYHIATPTTYAGSEMTPILGETKDGLKTTWSDPKIQPGSVIYDVDLTISLPVSITCVSGVNALAHAVEALYARKGNPIIDMIAQEGVRALASSLPQLTARPDSQSGRSTALYGAWLCSICAGSVGLALHHKLCHVLGGSFGLPHAETHSMILPHALAYNAPKVPKAIEKLATALPDSNGDAVQGLNVLLEKLSVPNSLRELGMKESDIDVAADIALKNAYWNPRVLERSRIRELIRRAWAGEEAKADL
ncbi:putative maleylacetate reductase [Xylaria venustula]|nr:putative maleylacetate reductase [Xylaria venustula]